jgi:DnaK suppressor protein
MPLNSTELAEFRVMLTDLQKKHLRHLASSSKDVTTADDSSGAQSQHPGDMGTDVALKEITLALIVGEEAEIAEIEAAIKRLDEGVYGICEDTGVDIPIKRLKVVPWARKTAEAQTKYEKKKAMYR